MSNKTAPNESSRKFDVEKWIWTDADFERMGWHDVRLHGIARYEKVERDEAVGSEKHYFGTELLLDIDYILKWVTADPNHWKFWIAPSTLVFENAYDFEMREGAELQWEISDIHREPAHYPSGRDCWKWQIWGTGIILLAEGYKQYIRNEPVLSHFQCLTWEERGGPSFSKQTPEREYGKS
jgi:hypothetical protein